MSPRQWLAMLAFYVSYLFFGASVFYTLEQDLETERRIQALQDRIDVNGIEFIPPLAVITAKNSQLTLFFF